MIATKFRRDSALGVALAAAVVLVLVGAAVAPPPPRLHRLFIKGHLPPPAFPADNPLTDEGIALGRRLFFDRGLSADGTVSCADCHLPRAAFSDDKAASRGVYGQRSRRHSMPLFNLAWRRGFFWDGRATTLREQVLHPLTDPTEMGETPRGLAAKLSADPSLRRDFAAAFGPGPPTTATLALALEQYMLVQISQDSKYDRAAMGETTFTALEARGLELFFQEFAPARGLRGADCFHCHGTPLFTNERFADNGLGPLPPGDRRGLDPARGPDRGRAEVTGRPRDEGAFKVPSLRNVALTAPYMHDGRMGTLRQVLDHYDRHVVDTGNLDPNLAKHGGPLGLTDDDKDALLAFLGTLTDTAFTARAEADQTAERALHPDKDRTRPPPPDGPPGRRPPPPPPR